MRCKVSREDPSEDLSQATSPSRRQHAQFGNSEEASELTARRQAESRMAKSPDSQAARLQRAQFGDSEASSEDQSEDDGQGLPRFEPEVAQPIMHCKVSRENHSEDLSEATSPSRRQHAQFGNSEKASELTARRQAKSRMAKSPDSQTARRSSEWAQFGDSEASSEDQSEDDGLDMVNGLDIDMIGLDLKEGVGAEVLFLDGGQEVEVGLGHYDDDDEQEDQGEDAVVPFGDDDNPMHGDARRHDGDASVGTGERGGGGFRASSRGASLMALAESDEPLVSGGRRATGRRGAAARGARRPLMDRGTLRRAAAEDAYEEEEYGDENMDPLRGDDTGLPMPEMNHLPPVMDRLPSRRGRETSEVPPAVGAELACAAPAAISEAEVETLRVTCEKLQQQMAALQNEMEDLRTQVSPMFPAPAQMFPERCWMFPEQCQMFPERCLMFFERYMTWTTYTP
jgi:hypothetical protein